MDNKILPGTIWNEPTTGMEFIWIPGGRFKQGQSISETNMLLKKVGQERFDALYKRELPRHKVIVDGFWMGKYPVTRHQYRIFCQKTGYQTNA